MKHPWSVGFALASAAVAAVACSSSSQGQGSPSGVDASSSGTTGGGASSGGASSGGASSGGASGGGTSSGSVADATGGSTDAGPAGDASTSSSGGDASLGPFACTEVIGLLITSEWWNAGFLSDGVDPTKFEIKWHHQGYVQAWADPASPFWANQGDAGVPDAGAPIVSPCAADSTKPDRVLFVAVDFDLVTEQAWVTALNAVVANLKAKYSPTLKWIDLTTLVRCPGDTMCNPSENYGTGANVTVSREDCYVPPYVDSAIASVIAANPDFVGLGPEPEATMCDPTISGPHLSAASNAAAASAIAAFYVQHP
jgi:hypothetical protein